MNEKQKKKQTMRHLRESEIIEHSLVDEALRESERRFRDIVLSMPGWVWELDAKGVYTYCSDRVEQILGYPADEIIGKPFTWLVQPDEVQKVNKLLNYVFDKKWPLGELEIWHHRRDGQAVCLLFNGVPVLDDADHLQGYRGVAKDITEKKQSEREKERLIEELEKALSRIKTLRGLIPICASCKKIRDDQGYWNKLEAYIESHSEAEFSHGICPDCLKKLYPNIKKKRKDTIPKPTKKIRKSCVS